MKRTTRFVMALFAFVAFAAAYAADGDADTIKLQCDDGVFQTVQMPDGTINLKYIWETEAVVYQMTLRDGVTVNPGRSLIILKIKNDKEGKIPNRRKEIGRAHV